MSNVGGLLTAALRLKMGSPFKEGGGVGVSEVVATLSASPSSESKRSAGGPSLSPQVGLEMVEEETTDCKGVKLGLLEEFLLETMVL